jgi:hypothetical protein
MTPQSESEEEVESAWLQALFTPPPLTRSQLVNALVRVALDLHSGAAHEGLRGLVAVVERLRLDTAREELLEQQHIH